MNCEVQKNKKSLDEIEKLKKDIEQMSKVNHVEVLRLFKQNRIQLNENQNGVFINMTELDDAIIDKLQQYVEYVSSQHKELSQQEKVKENFHKTFFNKNDKDDKDNKDNAPTNVNEQEQTI